MTWDRHQLAALAAVVRTGSFDAAARELHVTPSAVSQRIKALENASGQILVRRGRPSTATEAGHVLIRLGEQTELLEREAAAELRGADDVRVRLPVAVNADSLSAWFLPVLAAVAAKHAVVFDVHKEDEGESAELLRNGSVMAAVTAEPAPVQGCASVPLGSMRYLPMASQGFVDRYLDGPLGATLAHAPMLNFNRSDGLQQRYLRTITRRVASPPIHFIPSSAAFNEAVRLGLGWGLVPEQDLRPDEASRPDGLVRLDDRHVDVPLYWQHWRLESLLLRTLTDEVREHAAVALNDT